MILPYCPPPMAVNNTVVLTIASLKYTVPYIVKYTYSTVLACMLVVRRLVRASPEPSLSKPH